MMIISISCSNINRNEKVQENEEESEWNKIKNSSDFCMFFDFALKTKDSTLLNQCIDTLDELILAKQDLVLHYYEFYDFDNDSFIKKIAFEDLRNKNVDYWKRNAFLFKIDSFNQVTAFYRDSLIQNYCSELLYLFETKKISNHFPEVINLSYKGRDYYSKKLVIFIETQTYSDKTNNKPLWLTIFTIITEVKNTVDMVKQNKAIELYNTGYKELNSERRNIIDGVIPLWVSIYFRPFSIPPSPNLQDK